jgi:hypothetical protein
MKLVLFIKKKIDKERSSNSSNGVAKLFTRNVINVGNIVLLPSSQYRMEKMIEIISGHFISLGYKAEYVDYSDCNLQFNFFYGKKSVKEVVQFGVSSVTIRSEEMGFWDKIAIGFEPFYSLERR